MKIWHISDPHTYHWLLEEKDIPNVDVVVCSGDVSIEGTPGINDNDVLNFIEWFKTYIPIKHKIFVAGNHDMSIEARRITPGNFAEKGIIYLENQATIIDGVKFWGSPVTPTYGNWGFMRKRGKLAPLWDTIPEDTDVLITHGPPQSILDLTLNKQRELEQVGCKELYNRIMELPNLKANLFGHVHNCKGVHNQGVMKLPTHNCLFSNGSLVEDGKFGKISSKGNIIEI